MTVSLPKGGNLLLADESPGIERVRVGLGWSQGQGFAGVELDGLISLVGGASSTGRLLLTHQVPNAAEPVSAHPPTGPTAGDGEKLVVTLYEVPAAVTRLLFGVTVYDAAQRNQTFRSVHGAYVRVLNDANGIELARYTLEQTTGVETAMVFGELYRHSRGWKFRAVGQGYADGVRGVAGVTVGEPTVARPVDVASYLRRTSPARSRRSFAEILHPPKPSPAASTPPPAPNSPAPTPPASKPPAPTPPAPKPLLSHRPASPSSAAPSKRPAPARSALDLSGPDHGADDHRADDHRADIAAGEHDVSTPAPLVFGKHSSRYRQRMERVAALDADHPATTWTEDERGSGAMTVTLRWEPLHTATGLPRPSDLQLGCFWQSSDRAAGILQTLGNTISAPGAFGPRQVLRLGRRDEREGQTIFVDLATLPTFRRFFVYAYGQHGSPEWDRQRPVLTVAAASGEQLSIRLADAPPSARLCMVASFHVVAGDLIIRRENDYFDGVQAGAAPRYGWTFDWNPDGMTVRPT